MALLEVRGLEVAYGPVTAVRDLTLSIEQGTVAVLLGANGAGKTSTLNALSGLVPAKEGQVSFEGREITGWAAHKITRTGLVQVPEGRRVIAPLSVEENLLLGAYTLKGKGRRQALLDEVYELFPVLSERRSGAGGLLSGGEQQMLAFGRALMSDPRMLMLDEPSMGLAPVMVDAVMDAVAEIARRGISILMVEQNAAAAFPISSDAYVIEQGEIILSGNASEVSGDPRVVRAFLGIDDAGDEGL